MIKQVKIIINVILVIVLIQGAAYAQKIPAVLSLDQAIEIAGNNNPLIKKASEEISLLKAFRNRSWVPPMSDIVLEYEGMPTGTYFKEFEVRKLKIEQGMEFPLKSIQRYKRESDYLSGAELTLEMELLNIRADVKTAYYKALAAKEKLTFAEKNLSLSESMLEKIRIRYELGEIGSIDYHRANLQKNMAMNDLSGATSEYRSSMEELLFLLTGGEGNGQTGYDQVNLSGRLEFRKVDLSSLGNITNIIPAHAGLKAAEKKLDASENNLSLAKLSYLPDIGIGYSNEKRPAGSGFWGFGIKLSVPLWFMWDQKEEVAAASAQRNIADWNRVRTYNRINTDLKTAVIEMEEAEKQVQVFENDILSGAEKVFELTEISYREGEISYIEVILAQQSLLETRQQYSDLLAKYNIAAAQLELAMGRQLN
ncbi:TolC family protein [candidate division KSB1 bacterium]